MKNAADKFLLRTICKSVSFPWQIKCVSKLGVSLKGRAPSKLTRVWGWFCMPGFTILIKRFSLNSFAHLWKPVASLLKASTKPMVKTFSMYYIFYKETTDRMTAWHALKLTNPKIHDWKCSFGIQGSQESSAHPRKKTCRIYSMGTCKYSGNNMTSSGQLAPNHLSLVCLFGTQLKYTQFCLVYKETPPYEVLQFCPSKPATHNFLVRKPLWYAQRPRSEILTLL